MKLSISNIAWENALDDNMYDYIKDAGFSGVEIAPTRVIQENPYDNLDKAKAFKNMMDEKGLEISSMQSIWFKRSERIFYEQDERSVAIDYTKKSIDFADILGCKNLVFGCPKNRSFENEEDIEKGLEFFEVVGAYAKEKGTVFALEPNPTIYNTNFINTSKQAFDFVKKYNFDGLMVNLDFGTIVQNKEDLSTVKENLNLINHVHISEPFLEKIEHRKEHNELCAMLNDGAYNGYVSIEMKNLGDIDIVKSTMEYIKGVFA